MVKSTTNSFKELKGRIQRAVEIREFITSNVAKHPKDIARLVIEKFGITRATAVKHLRDLSEEGVLESEGITKNRTYRLKEIVDVYISLEVTPQLQEDVVWIEQVKPLISENTPENVLGICAHGFTEMLNNVIDHSESEFASIHVKRNANRIEFWITDRGVGIFKKIQRECNLEDIHHAILELAKGKLTTNPAKHSGEGIFFTSRMFEFFMISSENIEFMRSGKDDWLFERTTSQPAPGTSVNMEIGINAIQTAKEVMDTYRAEFDSFGFSKTIIPLKLMEYEGEKLISRSQAKRLLARADKFKEVVLDFNGITEIGQAFADQIFRVYKNLNPHVHLYPINTTDYVRSMIHRAEKAADNADQESLFPITPEPA